MKTKTTTTRKKPAPSPRVSARPARPEVIETAADYPSPANPDFTVKIRPHIAEFFGPDGALVSTLGNGPRGSEAADKLAAALRTLGESHRILVTHA